MVELWVNLSIVDPGCGARRELQRIVSGVGRAGPPKLNQAQQQPGHGAKLMEMILRKRCSRS